MINTLPSMDTDEEGKSAQQNTSTSSENWLVVDKH